MKRKILFVQPSVAPPGGGNGVAAWMLHWLLPRYDVTLLSMSPLCAEETDRYYGTSLAGQPFTQIVWANGLAEFLYRLPLPTALLRLHLMMRAARRHAQGDYDLVCSACDEQDFGRPSIEYIHYPWNHYPRPDAPPGWNDSRFLRGVVRVYSWGCQQISGFRKNRRPANLTLVNSHWTGRLVQKVYPGTSYRVLYPPALADPLEDTERSAREPRFLSIGRVAPSKEWLKLIDIVAALRSLGHPVGLTLAGSRDCRRYEAAVRERIAQEGDWVRLVTDFQRSDLIELMRTHEYGLHGMRDEHYGMAVAELLLGGCLTMVPNDGGQVEIVTDPLLRYDSVEEAVKKWDRILRDPELKSTLLEAQQVRRADLTRERFVAEFAQLVEACLHSGPTGLSQT